MSWEDRWLPIPRGELGQAVAAFVGIRGQVDLSLPRAALPVVQVGNVLDSPYLKLGELVGGGRATAAVVGEFGYVVACPGPRKVLQIKTLLVHNNQVTTQVCALQFLTAANIETLGVTATTSMVSLVPRKVGTQAVSSSVRSGSDTTVTFGTATNIAFIVAAGSMFTLDFPEPGIMVYGDDGGGLAVVNATANEEIRARFIGREWPLPTD